MIENKFAKIGIIHFWDLPKNIHVLLNSEYQKYLMKALLHKLKTKENISKLTGISKTTLQRLFHNPYHKFRIDFLQNISHKISKQKYSLKNIERNIRWIGHKNSPGILNPKYLLISIVEPALDV